MLIFAQIAPILSIDEANEHILVVFSVTYPPGHALSIPGHILWVGSVYTGIYPIWLNLLFLVCIKQYTIYQIPCYQSMKNAIERSGIKSVGSIWSMLIGLW